MKENNLTAFASIMMNLGILYDKVVSEALIEIYWNALKQFDLEIIKKALQQHIDHPDVGQYMPKPADIRRAITGSSESQALAAWSKVLDAIRKVGAYQSVAFDDSLIHAVIYDMGGWTQLCRCRETELTFYAREFEKRYRAYLLQPPLNHPKKLCGIFDDQIVFIGDENKAQKVHQLELGSKNNERLLTTFTNSNSEINP